ncbi:MAG: hypothetical protein AAGK78_06805 [Planctomycetota bacterium]
MRESYQQPARRNSQIAIVAVFVALLATTQLGCEDDTSAATQRLREATMSTRVSTDNDAIDQDQSLQTRRLSPTGKDASAAGYLDKLLDATRERPAVFVTETPTGQITLALHGEGRDSADPMLAGTLFLSGDLPTLDLTRRPGGSEPRAAFTILPSPAWVSWENDRPTLTLRVQPPRHFHGLLRKWDTLRLDLQPEQGSFAIAAHGRADALRPTSPLLALKPADDGDAQVSSLRAVLDRDERDLAAMMQADQDRVLAMIGQCAILLVPAETAKALHLTAGDAPVLLTAWPNLRNGASAADQTGVLLSFHAGDAFRLHTPIHRRPGQFVQLSPVAGHIPTLLAGRDAITLRIGGEVVDPADNPVPPVDTMAVDLTPANLRAALGDGIDLGRALGVDRLDIRPGGDGFVAELQARTGEPTVRQTYAGRIVTDAHTPFLQLDRVGDFDDQSRWQLDRLLVTRLPAFADGRARWLLLARDDHHAGLTFRTLPVE